MKEKLLNILDIMDVPEHRKNLSEWNLKWLLRNISIRNGNHPDIAEAMQLILALLRGE